MATAADEYEDTLADFSAYMAVAGGRSRNTWAHLKVSSDVGVAVALSHSLADLATKDVVHNACALLKVVQAGQQSPEVRQPGRAY